VPGVSGVAARTKERDLQANFKKSCRERTSVSKSKTPEKSELQGKGRMRCGKKVTLLPVRGKGGKERQSGNCWWEPADVASPKRVGQGEMPGRGGGISKKRNESSEKKTKKRGGEKERNRWMGQK